MTLRKITIDNSVRYVSKDSNWENELLTKENKPNTASIPKKQNKNFSQNNENFIKNKTREEFRILK